MEEMKTTGYRISVEGKTGEEATIRLAGRLSLDDLEPLMADLQAIPGRLKPRRLSVDLAGVDYLDSAGALALIELENIAKSLTIPFDLLNVSGTNHGLLGLIDREALQRPPLRPESVRPAVLEKLGEVGRSQYRDFLEIMSFVGQLVVALAYSLAHPRSVRWEDVKFYMKRAGADGLPDRGAHQPAARPHHGLHVVSSAQTVRGHHLRGQPRDPCHGPRTGSHHDGHPGGGPLRVGIRRGDRHHGRQ
jgi:ABC-type transporter Mla MlaB component